MLPEAGAFELIFLAAVALIVVGPKDLPVLLRKVGQWTAKMRGLAAEFRASFDEMARQSELDELRKEVEALRTGQFMSSTTAAVESHVGEINDHLSHNYWDGAAQADPAHGVFDPHTGAFASEADETAALPPPGSRTPPLPRPAKKLASARKATGAAESELETPKATKARGTPAVKKAVSEKPMTKPSEVVAPPSRKAVKTAAKPEPTPTDPVKTPRKRAKAPTSTEAAEI